MKKIKNTFKRFFYRIKRVLRYLPVIWKSYDFDYRYALDLFEMKLEDLASHMESDNSYSLNAKEDAKKIRTALRLMKKVYNEEYACEYQNQLKQLYGDDVLDWEFVQTDDISDYDEEKTYTMVWKYESWDNAEEIKQKKNELVKQSYLKQKKAHRILWKFIEHNIQHWWD